MSGITWGKRTWQQIIISCALLFGLVPSLALTGLIEGGVAAAQSAGKILFVSDRGGSVSNNNIFSMNPDGSGQTNLTNATGRNLSPAWSRDGSKIAFQTDRGGNFDIFVMNPDGSGTTNLTNSSAADGSPSWSPDGRKLAFISGRAIGAGNLYLMNADGSGQANLTHWSLAEDNPEWSPDGSKIALTRYISPSSSEIFVIKSDGSDASGGTDLTNTPASEDKPRWSPDGSKIAFTTNRDGNWEIYVMNANGSGQSRLTNNPAPDTGPAWSPDGSKITFTSGRDGNSEIYVMNADGSGQTNLTRNPAADLFSHWGMPAASPQATATTQAPTATTAPIATAPPATPVPLPGSGSRTFPETGKTVTGIFLDYWDKNGGLPQQGYPISNVISEKSDLNGQVYTVQYFERAVFEYHPEQTDPKYQVLLSQLGTFQYKKKYGAAGAPNQKANTSNPLKFQETGKTMGGKFRAYWEAHGGLPQQGYPISDEFQEVSDLNGQTYTVQYFERAVFELHPENAGTPYEVLLSQLGKFQYDQKYGGGIPKPPAAPVSQPTTVSQPTVVPTAPQAQPTNTAAASNPCADVPPSPNVTISPSACKPVGVERQFTIVASGFQPGEKVGVYATAPDGSVGGAPFQLDADAQGRATVYLTLRAGAAVGVWADTMEGVDSHQRAVAYIKVYNP